MEEKASHISIVPFTKTKFRRGSNGIVCKIESKGLPTKKFHQLRKKGEDNDT